MSRAAPVVPADRARYVREMFGAISRRYDFLNHFLSAGLDRRWRRRAAEACAEVLATPPLRGETDPRGVACPRGCMRGHAGGHRAEHAQASGGLGMPPPATESPATPPTVLDLCAGTGDMAMAVLARMPGARVIACDFSRFMLQRARLKFERARAADRAAGLEADALALPLPDAAVDAVICAFGLRNLADPVRGLAEMARVVRLGGPVVLLEFYPPQGRGPLAAVFRLYFRRILPRLGAWISGGDRGGYQYLVDSIQAFRTPAELADAMGRAGLEGVSVEPLIGGVAAVFAGRRAR